MQGIAFGVPVSATMAGLGLAAGTTTEDVLTRAAAPAAASADRGPFEDDPDEKPDLIRKVYLGKWDDVQAAPGDAAADPGEADHKPGPGQCSAWLPGGVQNKTCPVVY